MGRPAKVALQLFGVLGVILLWAFFSDRLQGCGVSQQKVPDPVCVAGAHGGLPNELADALAAASNGRMLLRDDAGAGVVLLEALVVLLPASESRPPAEALAAALAPLTPEIRAALRDRAALVVWLGHGQGRAADAGARPSWDAGLRLDLAHDDLTLDGCLARAAAAPDPARRISKEKFDDHAENIAHAEKALVQAVARTVPLADAAARRDHDQKLMHSSGIWAERARSLPISAAVLLGVLLIFFWRAAADDAEATLAIAALDAPTLVRDGALCIPPQPGQRYRILSYGLLHTGLQHLLNNGVSLYIGCYILEPALGAPRTLLVFLAGVLGGGWARLFLRREGLLVGASGGAFAMNGAGLVLVLLGAAWVPLIERQGFVILQCIMLGAGLLLSFMPNISLVCHLGGALAGVLVVVSGLITLGRPDLDGGVESQLSAILAWAIAGAAIAAWIFSGIWVRHLDRPKS
jgi:rhomboid protease GluP